MRRCEYRSFGKSVPSSSLLDVLGRCCTEGPITTTCPVPAFHSDTRLVKSVSYTSHGSTRGRRSENTTEGWQKATNTSSRRAQDTRATSRRTNCLHKMGVLCCARFASRSCSSMRPFCKSFYQPAEAPVSSCHQKQPDASQRDDTPFIVFTGACEGVLSPVIALVLYVSSVGFATRTAMLESCLAGNRTCPAHVFVGVFSVKD